MARHLVSSGSPFESVIGFSRAVRIGQFISVAGTAPIGSDGATVGVGDVRAQTQRCLDIIGAALADAGASLENVIRTRILLVNIDDWEAAAEVHGRAFTAIRPAATFMAVRRFINPEWLIEIEADAVVED